jgi:hypothetical protein
MWVADEERNLQTGIRGNEAGCLDGMRSDCSHFVLCSVLIVPILLQHI